MRSSALAPVIMLLVSCFSLLSLAAVFRSSVSPISDGSQIQQHLHEQLPNPIPVPVTLGVMSRCPDALLCESVFDEVLDIVGHTKVDLNLSFIASLNASDPVYGVTCMHGTDECAGNVHELCVAKYTTSSSVWWPFLQCLNSQGRDRIGTEKTAKDCAATTKIDWVGSGIEACVKGPEGPRLLRESVLHTIELGVKKSCTILISNKVRCIHDGVWSECDAGHEPKDFVDTINTEYDNLNPPQLL